MIYRHLILLVIVVLPLTAFSQEPTIGDIIGKSANDVKSWSLDTIPWGNPGENGSKFAVLEGLSDQPGADFTFAFYLPDGEWFPGHWHCADARTFVAKGTLLLGEGTRKNTQKIVEHPEGSYVIIPHKYEHFEGAKGDLTIIFTGRGPWCTRMTE